MKILFGELIGVFESQTGYEVTVVHVIGEGKTVWSGPKVIASCVFDVAGFGEIGETMVVSAVMSGTGRVHTSTRTALDMRSVSVV